jgi:HK97 family phage prohead protease/HK97 family phage major capsid protein
MTVIHKTVAASGGAPLEFVLSDDTVDRYGDIIEAAGWDLRNFKKNPIALFGHSSSFPIGTWENLRIDGNRLIGRLALAAKGTSDRIDELIGLVEQGILRAVSVGFRAIDSDPIDPKQPWGAQRYKKQELLETSVVAVPANPAALALAKSLNLSNETMSLVFGEHADVRRRDVSATGEHADPTNANEKRARVDLPSRPKETIMKTLAQRIEDAQNALVIKRDKLVELTGVEILDVDAVEALTGQIDIEERSLAALKASEAKIGIGAAAVSGVATPNIARRSLSQREVKGADLVIRGIVARGIAHFGGKSIDQVLDERYPGHDATKIVTKADQTIGTTTVSGWASELVQTAYADFVQALVGYSIYPALRDKGIGLSFDAAGTVSIPSRTAGGSGGGFVGEGQPIRVGRITTAATTMTPRKMGVIVPFSRELAKRSTPVIEALVRQAIVEDTGVILDAALLDAAAGDTVRPAGLLNGVSAIGGGYGGADYQAVIEDFKALLAPFITANAADNITVVMNPTQGLSLALMPGPSGQPNWFSEIQKRINVVESTRATAGRLVALRNSDFATALGDAPEFDISEQATVHMEDTTPLEIVSGTGPTTADPVRSFFQTATIGVRMLMDVSWKMRRTGMVQWIDGTSW